MTTTVVSPLESLRRQATRSTHRIYSLPQLVLMPHSRCNCRCVMCDIWQANADKRELTREDLERQLDVPAQPARAAHGALAAAKR